MNIEEIISRISYFRLENNLSARELSLKIDKNGAYINHLESSKFNIKLSILLDVLEALEISCEEFFSENYRDYSYDKEILFILKNLSTDRKKTFIELMKNTK